MLRQILEWVLRTSCCHQRIIFPHWMTISLEVYWTTTVRSISCNHHRNLIQPFRLSLMTNSLISIRKISLVWMEKKDSPLNLLELWDFFLPKLKTKIIKIKSNKRLRSHSRSYSRMPAPNPIIKTRISIPSLLLQKMHISLKNLTWPTSISSSLT